MTKRKSRSQPLCSGNISTDMHRMDTGAYDAESLKPNKTAAFHQSTSIEALANYTISVLGPDPSTQSSPLVDNCLENLQIEAEKKEISKQSKQPAESDKVLIIKEKSLESKCDVQKCSLNNHIHLSLHFNAPVTNVSLELYMKASEKECQSDDNLPQIKVRVRSQCKINSSRSPEDYKDHVYMQDSKSAFEASTSDGQRNVAVKRKGGKDDEESISSQISRYSKMSKRRKSWSVGCENRTVENEKICNCKCKCCCCNNASTSKETAKHKDFSRRPFPNRRIADIFDLRNRSRKKEVVKSKRKPKSKMRKNKITKSQRTLSQWVT